MSNIDLVQIIVTASLVTLIWLVQILHYPFFYFVSESDFEEAMLFHQRRITWIVLPLMVAELGLSGHSAIQGQPGSYLCLGIVCCIWISTFLFQVPIHRKLDAGKCLTSIDLLVHSNWIRTILWTIKLIILIELFAK